MDNSANVYAVDRVTGREKWTYVCKLAGVSITFGPTGVLVADGRAMLACADGNIHAINATTGQRLWVYVNFRTKDEVNLGELQYYGDLAYAPADVAAGTPPLLYVASMKNKTLALNAITGAVVWQYYSPRLFAANSITLYKGVVYTPLTYINEFTAEDAYPSFPTKTRVMAFNGTTGEVLWFQDISNWVWNFGDIPVLNDRYLILPDTSGVINALDITDGGTPAWAQPVSVTKNMITGVAVGHGNVYFGDWSGMFYALRGSDQAVVWQVDLVPLVQKYNMNAATYSMGVWFAPVLVGDQLYVPTRRGLFVLNAITGDVSWTYASQRFAGSPAVLPGGQIIIPAYPSEILSITPQCIEWEAKGLPLVAPSPPPAPARPQPNKALPPPPRTTTTGNGTPAPVDTQCAGGPKMLSMLFGTGTPSKVTKTSDRTALLSALQAALTATLKKEVAALVSDKLLAAPSATAALSKLVVAPVAGASGSSDIELHVTGLPEAASTGTASGAAMVARRLAQAVSRDVASGAVQAAVRKAGGLPKSLRAIQIKAVATEIM